MFCLKIAHLPCRLDSKKMALLSLVQAESSSYQPSGVKRCGVKPLFPNGRSPM